MSTTGTEQTPPPSVDWEYLEGIRKDVEKKIARVLLMVQKEIAEDEYGFEVEAKHLRPIARKLRSAWTQIDALRCAFVGAEHDATREPTEPAEPEGSVQ